MPNKLVMGNWKMNGDLKSNSVLIKAMLGNRYINRPGVSLAPPHAYLGQLSQLLNDSQMALAAQDVSQFCHNGAYTGEVSADMLKDLGCSYTLIGHSERRQYLAENPAILAQKMNSALEVGATPVLCVGETLPQRESGNHLTAIRCQLELLGPLMADKVIIAYEPVWAIGTGKVATLEQIREMHEYIKSIARSKGAGEITVLYGGSVKADNATTILAMDCVDGALVGGASLNADQFGVICQAAA
jgi:triosephosphate isomerase